MTHEYRLILVKGGEVTAEHLIGPSRYDDEIDDAGYDIRDAQFYLLDDDDNEIVIDTDLEFLEEAEEHIDLNDDQYVRYICWRTSEWVVKSEEPLTADDVIPVYRRFGDVDFIDFTIPKATEFEFDSSWDGKYEEILQEARNPTYTITEDDD